MNYKDFDTLSEDSYDVNEDIGNGWSILHAGAYLNRVECVKLLVGSGRVEPIAFYGHLGKRDNDNDNTFLDSSEIEISSSSSELPTALQIACSRGHIHVVLALKGLFR